MQWVLLYFPFDSFNLFTVTQTLVVWVCVQRHRSDCAPGFWIVVCIKLSRVVRVFCFDLVRVFSGWIFRKCCWFSNFIAAEAGWHQSQQARHEFAAFCCYGKIWNVDAVKYSTYFQLKKYSWCWFKKKKKKSSSRPSNQIALQSVRFFSPLVNYVLLPLKQWMINHVFVSTGSCEKRPEFTVISQPTRSCWLRLQVSLFFSPQIYILLLFSLHDHC